MLIDNFDLLPTYVLHQRPYKETSLLVELFTHTQGRIAVVAKGARAKRSPVRGLLLLGQPLLISARGRGDLLTLTHAESAGKPLLLNRAPLFSLFYVNEIILHSLHRGEAYPAVYEAYTRLLDSLGEGSENSVNSGLRRFEYQFIHAMGYGIDLAYESKTRALIQSDAWYCITPEMHVEQVDPVFKQAYSGAVLLACSSGIFPDDPQVWPQAKRLMRQLLYPLLGDREIKSRCLFQ